MGNGCTNEKVSEGVVIGPCCCGGYGQVLHEEAARREGRCHIPLGEITEDADWRAYAEKRREGDHE